MRLVSEYQFKCIIRNLYQPLIPVRTIENENWVFVVVVEHKLTVSQSDIILWIDVVSISGREKLWIKGILNIFINVIKESLTEIVLSASSKILKILIICRRTLIYSHRRSKGHNIIIFHFEREIFRVLEERVPSETLVVLVKIPVLKIKYFKKRYCHHS